MTDKPMTPSEIADWLEIEAEAVGFVVGLAGDAPHLRQAAATIRAQAEALKIATEALEEIGYSAEARTGYLLSECVGIARISLARMKEVGA